MTKQVLKYAVLVVVVLALIGAGRIALVRSRVNAPLVAVLVYHEFVAGNEPGSKYLVVSEGQFRQQMEYLRSNGYHTVTADQLRRYVAGTLRLPQKSVLITVDDGYVSNYDVMFRVLKEFGFRATLFERTSRAETPNHLTWEQMREMHQSGLFDIASHSHEGHYEDTPLTYDFWIYDLAIADSVLAGHGLPRPVAFSYPMGRTNADVTRAVRDHGYGIAFLATPGYVHVGDPVLELHRFAVINTTTPEQFAALVGGGAQ